MPSWIYAVAHPGATVLRPEGEMDLESLERLLKVDERTLISELRRRGAGDRIHEAVVPEPSTGITIDLATISTDELIVAARAVQKGVYGVDDRVDVYELTDSANKADSEGVVALFWAEQLTENEDGTFSLRTVKYGDKYRLCSMERFHSQPTGAFCSGVLVAADIVATAGHCINEANVGRARFVFGFRMMDAMTAVVRLAPNDVFEGREVLGRREVKEGADWALVRLNRASDRKPARIRTTGRLPDNEKLHVVGHPCGLPAKFAAGATVRSNESKAFFVANLDTYGGNSGSPVFNSSTHIVEGLLVRGERDFVKTDGDCFVSMVCPTTGCRGEDCTRTTEFYELLPKEQ